MAKDKRSRGEIAIGPRLIGYARVSTLDQNLDMQVQALRRVGVAMTDVHVEKVSASAQRRPVLEWMLKAGLREGDTVVVWKLDRLARSMTHMLAVMERFKELGVSLRSITESIDTSTPGGTFLFHMLTAAAQLERDLIRERTRTGVEAAKARGVKFGQPAKLLPKQQAMVRRWRREKLSVRVIADRVKNEFGVKVSHTTIANYLKGKR